MGNKLQWKLNWNLCIFILEKAFENAVCEMAANLSLPQCVNYTNPGYGLSLVDTLWNAGSYGQLLEQEGNPMT